VALVVVAVAVVEPVQLVSAALAGVAVAAAPRRQAVAVVREQPDVPPAVAAVRGQPDVPPVEAAVPAAAVLAPGLPPSAWPVPVSAAVEAAVGASAAPVLAALSLVVPVSPVLAAVTAQVTSGHCVGRFRTPWSPALAVAATRAAPRAGW